jgi:hypothetical protein
VLYQLTLSGGRPLMLKSYKHAVIGKVGLVPTTPVSRTKRGLVTGSERYFWVTDTAQEWLRY